MYVCGGREGEALVGLRGGMRGEERGEYARDVGRVVGGAGEVGGAEVGGVVGDLVGAGNGGDEVLFAGVVGHGGTVFGHVEEIAAFVGVRWWSHVG